MNERHRRVYPWKRRQRRLLFVVCIAAVLIGIPFLNGLRVRAQVQREIDAIRATGDPVSFAGLALFSNASSEALKNARAYQKAFSAKLEAIDKDTFFDFKEAYEDAPAHGRFPDSLIALLRARLDADAPKLRLLHEAIQGPPARFPLDWNQGQAMALPHLAPLRDAVTLLELEALLAAHEGRIEDAVRAVQGMFTAAATLNEDPALICQLVRISSHTHTQETLKRMLEIASLNEEQLRQLGTLCQDGDRPDALTRALIAERVSGMDIYATGDLHFIPGMARSERRKVAELLRAMGWFGAEEIRYLHLMADMINASRNPYHVAIPAMQDLANRFRSNGGGHGYNISAAILPAVESSVRAFLRGAATLRTAHAATAIERYRLKNGKAPAQLDALRPDFLDVLPEDPYDGKPLRYKTEGNGYVVYSIGENGKDDDAKEPENPKKRAPDICFRVER